jgi:hypothetical protein
MIALPRGQTAPDYQKEVAGWLQQFKHTELLQQLLARYQFSEAEIAAYTRCWADWLKPRQGIN